jgi:hypothetical protein
MASDPKNLGAKFDAHTDAEFNTRDIEANGDHGRGAARYPRADHDRRLGV